MLELDTGHDSDAMFSEFAVEIDAVDACPVQVEDAAPL